MVDIMVDAYYVIDLILVVIQVFKISSGRITTAI
jgi:hypothetical protein